uniref:Holliday junction resolvase n=1 Tax=Salinispora arenicola (strain CNS-205) TaxID=391037 RepID=A8M006_SALAI
MARPRDIGTRTETAVVRYLQPHGWPHAERRSLRGAHDAGDITGTPGICWEIKGGDAARNASDLTISRWMLELAVEVTNAHANIGVLVVQRAGIGPANAGRWWAVMPAHQVIALATGVEPALRMHWPVRMLLGDAATLLHAAGYGQPQPAAAA